MNFKNATIDLVTSDACTGCAACVDACSRRALSFSADEQGFYRPLLDRARCTDCGACSQHCPVLIDCNSSADKGQPRVFGGWSNDDAVRSASTSGGIAFELASSVLAEGGVVVGCVMGEDCLPHHRLITTKSDLGQTQGSKYLPSRLDGIYQQVVAEAKWGRKVFFTGTPCQVAALQAFLKGAERENVITADLICYGVPSTLPWRKHLLESFEGRLEKVDFRDKSSGWSSSSVKYTLADGSIVRRQPGLDAFVSGFHATAFHQLICHACPFAKLPRQGDLTLGDFWGVPARWKDERGVSVIVASTQRGLRQIERLQEAARITLFATAPKIAAAANPRLTSNRPVELPYKRRDEVLHRLMGGETLASVAKVYLPSRGKRLLKRAFPQVVKMSTPSIGQNLRKLLMCKQI